MSIDKNAWAGYGVSGIIDEPTDLLRASEVPAAIRTVIDDEDLDLETEMDKFLGEHKIDRIAVFVSGNSWTGVERWNVVIRRTIASVDESDPMSWLGDPTQLDLVQLAEAIALFGIDREFGWMLQMDVN
jgi:hypothetical protein